MIKTILVATDGSGHAKKAIDLAADIAGKYGARMVILHVLLRHTSESDIEALCKENAMPDALEKKFEEMRKAFLEVVAVSYDVGPLIIPVTDDVLNDVGDLILNDAKQRAASKGVEEVSAHIADGPPAETIIAAAEKENADMIVIGSRGLGSIAGLFMGSISHKVNHLSDRTCVMVK